MDALIQSFIATLTDWGYVGLFLSALLAGSVIPFSSELVIIGLIRLGLSPTLCVITATLGNTLGGLTCYCMGHLGKTEWIEKYLHVKKEKVERMQGFLQGRGALMAFFCFLPVVGSVIAIALGFMRSNVWFTSFSMFSGKLIRYIGVVLAMNGTINLFF
ncbi:MAG: DedA family protein [Bacteroides sp.]|nr:DedA family protein [Bacteroides sp.]